MATERRRTELILLGALVVLTATAYRLWPSQSATARPASNQAVAAPAAADAGQTPARERATRDLPAETEQETVATVTAERAATPTPAPAPAPARGGRPARGQTANPVVEAPSVHLTELEAERPKPVAAERNLFRFKEKPAPPPAIVRPAGGRDDASAAPPPPSAPTGPAATPQITLKYIGLVEQEGRAPKIAVLSDSAGHVSYGREGEIVDGRYRILKIGAESLDIAYVDGTGRRTIRLSGG